MWQFGLIDLIDILAVASLLYYIYRFTRENGTIVIFRGLITIIVVWLVVSNVFRMRLMGAILDQIISVAMIVLVILFQNEIRQALIRMGSRRQWTSVLRFFGQSQLSKQETDKWVDQVVMACKNMSEQKVGALIVLQRTDNVEPLVNSGCPIDAVVTSRLIEQIFYKNTPLHDGAMVIHNGRITLASAVLPVSHRKGIPPELGLRHRSALGITEVCDARVVVVSEETGAITVCFRGRLSRDLTLAGLQKSLLNK